MLPSSCRQDLSTRTPFHPKFIPLLLLTPTYLPPLLLTSFMPPYFDLGHFNFHIIDILRSLAQTLHTYIPI